jgi:hypothetical protein
MIICMIALDNFVSIVMPNAKVGHQYKQEYYVRIDTSTNHRNHLFYNKIQQNVWPASCPYVKSVHIVHL